MRVRPRDPTGTERELSYVPPLTRVSRLSEYDVHAVSVYDGVVFVLIVEDSNTPLFLTSAMFEVVDDTVPDDWICRLFSEERLQMVMGPAFIASSLQAYSSMIDSEVAPVNAFWDRLEARARRHQSREADE